MGEEGGGGREQERVTEGKKQGKEREQAGVERVEDGGRDREREGERGPRVQLPPSL